jgi:hypothetical protein
VAAAAVAGFNGFNSISVQYPATSGAHTGCLYVRVSVSRSMGTTFSRIVGQTSWTASAAAVSAMVKTQSAASANCTFCSLNSTNANHTLLVELGSSLVVDGDIYVNSANGLKANDPNSAVKLKDWNVGGDAYDIFGTGGKIQATNIDVVGGWETHDNDVASATQANCPSSQRPDPLAYSTLNPRPVANVCVHQPVLADPLGLFPAPVYSGYPVVATKQAHYGGSNTYTIPPGIYIGGIKIDGTAKVTMQPGVYYMAGGGFTVAQAGSVTGLAVTIYSGSQNGKSGAAGPVSINTTGTVTIQPSLTGLMSGMTIFMERASPADVTIQPNNTVQCATVASAGQPQGCIGGISGTIYAVNDQSTAIIKAAGTANLQVIAGRLLVQNGSTARFTFNAAGFAASTTVISLVE